MKKVYATVSWSRTVAVEVDETRLNDEKYLESVRATAIINAGDDLEAKCGFVVDCEDCPELVE